MSPIIDLQRRLAEVGRIRMGATQTYKRRDNTEGTRPVRLESWRLTSRDRDRLDAAALLYGGDVVPWDGQDGQFVLDTKINSLPIMLMPGQTLSQWYELWSGGGCKRRCDGVTETLSDRPCMCPQYDERAELAKDGKACKPTTRLNVLLPDVPGIGCWRFESHGYYAAVELAGTAELLEEATRRGSLLPARLRIDQRSQVKDGKTTKYPVPVIDIEVRVHEVLSVVGGPPQAQLEHGEQQRALPAAPEEPQPRHTPLPAAPAGPTVGEALDATGQQKEKKQRANAQAPLPDVPARSRRVAAPAVDEDGEPVPAASNEVAKQEPAATPAHEEPADGGEPADLGPAGAAPPGDSEPAAAPQAAGGATDGAPAAPGVVYANERQLKLLWATIRQKGVPEEKVREIVRAVTGQESTKQIPRAMFEAVLTSVQAQEAPAA